MATTAHTLTSVVDLDYVALCLTEQIVRIRLSATHYASDRGEPYDTARMLARPLYAVAAALDITSEVEALVTESLARIN